MERFYGYARVLASGAPAPGATVTVFDAGTLNLSSIFSDNLSTLKANPFVADSNAYAFFYAANGRYDVQFSGTGIAAPYTWGDHVLSDFISLNGLTTPSQLFAVGTAGNDFAISSAGSTHTFNLPDASATKRGAVTTGAQTFAGVKTFNTPIAADSGGTGLNASAAANGQLLIGNGTGFSLGTIGGTANQVLVSNGAGMITLSTPQNIDAAANVTFNQATLAGLTASSAIIASAGKVLTSVVLTDGQVLIGRTGNTPIAATLTGGTGISITNGAGSITVAATAVGITSLNGSTATTQTFGTGTSGTDFAIVTNAGAGSHTFNIPDASASARGLVTTGTQVFAGLKEFDIAPVYKPGSASTYAAKVIGIVHVNLTDVGNVGAGTDDLMTYALPAAMLSVDNKSLIRFTAWGIFGATANAKSVLVTFGATAITVIDATTTNTGHWRIQGEIVRVSATSQKTSAGGSSMSDTGTGLSAWAKTGTAAETLANSITLKIQAIGTANNDIVQKGMIVEILEMP